MDGFTFIDAIVAVIILLSAILAYSRGLVRESLAIAGWVAAAVVAYMFAAAARPLVAQVPVVDKLLGTSCELQTIVGFGAVFALALIVFSIVTPLFASVVQRSALGGIDQGLGFLFGVVRGVVLVAVAFVVFGKVVVDRTFPVVDDSRSATIFKSFQADIEGQMNTDVPGWAVERFNALFADCPAPAAAAAPAPSN